MHLFFLKGNNFHPVAQGGGLHTAFAVFSCFMRTLNSLSVRLERQLDISRRSVSRTDFSTKHFPTAIALLKTFFSDNFFSSVLYFETVGKKSDFFFLTPLVLFFYARKKVGKYFCFLQKCVKI